MPVHTGHQTEANCSSDSLGYLPLVDRSQSCVLGVLDLAQLRHVFRHHGKVLEHVSGKFKIFGNEESIPNSGSEG